MRILFLNPQGNFDRLDSHWTMHPDFGGQLVYVKEIAIAMANFGHKVDIVTRLFDDELFPEFKKNIDFYDNAQNIRIIRIPCGPNKFLNKEELWEYLDEWTDNIISFYRNENSNIDFITSHYGDGGLAAAVIKNKLHIPYSFTAHSLGAQKFDKLNNDFTNLSLLDKKFRFALRISAEKTAIKNADIIFVSTSQERDIQYQHLLYKPITKAVDKEKFVIAPPGANTKIFKPYWQNNVDIDVERKIEYHIRRDIDENRNDLPLIVLASRLDEKKNHIGLFEAYADSEYLKQNANILVSLRGVNNAYESYDNLKDSEQKIMNQIMQVISSENLKGKVTFISINSQYELANTYRYAAKNGGLFTLTSLYEPFGLAPIEAMACGLPACVTKYGGPSEVLEENNVIYGMLIDVHNRQSIIDGLVSVLNKQQYFSRLGYKRVMEKYTWEATAKKYLKAIMKIKDTSNCKTVELPNWIHDMKRKPSIESIKNAYNKGLE